MLEEEGHPHSLIKEIIIENFMSYEYARIPIRPGLNVICGPNGSGKSSILLALAVALGQTYTERSRRLSDLIRHGRDTARVTVVFENATRGVGVVPDSRQREFIISRYMSKNGTYWYEANHRAVTREEVRRDLSQMGINPDNMLIVMHQNMIDVFSTLDSREKLEMVEEAVGLHDYREKILETKERLSHTLSEKESIDSLLERARETLAHWRDEYERYLRKKSLLENKERLGVEYAWSKYYRGENIVNGILTRIGSLEGELDEVKRNHREGEKMVEKKRTTIEELERDQEAAYDERIIYERERAERQVKLSFLEAAEKSGLREEWDDIGVENPQSLRKDLKRYGDKIEGVKSMIVKLKTRLTDERGKYVDARVNVAVLEFRRELLIRELSELRSNLRKESKAMEELRREAEESGPRVKTERNPQEIIDEIRIINAQIVSLEDVSADAEKMYQSYKDLLEELEKKAETAAENRRRALEELKLRTDKWRSIITDLLGEVGSTYRKILNSIGADGIVRTVDLEEVERAGIELLVGFRGEPVVLDAYTHSGGERATSILCFLLALQKYIKSPIRAIDEFDIHMDPRNREEMMHHILRLMLDEADQYLVITPRELTDVERIPNIITVQNLKGASSVTVAT